MGRVLYNNNPIIPAPFCEITKEYLRAGDGSVIGKTYVLTLTNELVAHRGSPSSSGTFGLLNPDENVTNNGRLGAILRKQEALRELFSVDGLSLEIQSLDGSQPLRCNPRVRSVSFAQGSWYTTCPYTITVEADELYPAIEDDLPFPSAYLTSINESWQLDTEDTPENLNISRHYRLTHSVGAVGKLHFDDAGYAMPAWQQARNYVQSRLGFNQTMMLSSGVNNLPSYYSGYNNVRSETIDIAGGGYSVTEAWLITSGNYIEDFNISVQGGANTPRTNVSIQGNIQGLELRDGNLNIMQTKYANASAQFAIASGAALARAQAYSGKTLNIEPITTTYAINPVAGNISYTFEYDDRPSRLITGTKSEVITISNSFEVDAVAVIPVLGRTRGPVLQELSTKNVCERSLNIELIFSSDYLSSGLSINSRLNTYNPRLHSPQAAEIASIVDAANPSGKALNNIGSLASQAYITARSENWNPSNLQYGLQITWIYE